MTPLLALSGLSVARSGRPVLTGIDLTLAPGETVGLIGPNGAGKSTLMRAALGLIPAQGASTLAALTPAARARAAAWLPQARDIAWPVTVRTLVLLGRLPHGTRARPADHAAADLAMERMGLAALAHRKVTELSGGEQARALFARALAQDTPLILADEPVAGLDPAAQITAMQVLTERAANGGAVLVALHDLGLAARHCSRLMLLHQGRVLADDTPAKVLTPDRLAHAFGLRAYYAETVDGPVFQPLAVI